MQRVDVVRKTSRSGVRALVLGKGVLLLSVSTSGTRVSSKPLSGTAGW